MSSELRARRDGVQLEKYYEDDEFPLPSIVYEFESDRSTAVEVRVAEVLPEGIGPEDIGFHTDLGRDNWSLTAKELVWRGTVEPAGCERAVFALRPDQEYDIERLVDEPDAFDVQVPDPASLPARAGTFTRSAGSDGEDDPADDEDTPDVDREVARWGGDGAAAAAADDDLPDEPATGRTADEPATGGTADDETSIDPTDGESLADRLVAELRAGNVSTENRRYLQRELGGVQPRGSVDARLQQLQAKLSDFEAYTDAVEEFLDEGGTAEQLTETVETRLDAFEDDLRTLESTVAELAELQGDVADLDELTSTVADHESELESLDEDLSSLDEDMSSLDEDMSSLEEDLSSVQEGLETVREEVDAVSAELSGVTGTVEELGAEFSRLDEEATDGVEDRLAEVEAELEDVCEFADTLQEALQN
jgi:predicted  nucleic acid-binding Zn-ribbon protein